jgi:surface antigen
MAIVYLHKKKKTNDVFYVGIGRNLKRAYSKNNRNKYWKNVVSKYGFYVQVTHQDISWEEACAIEKYLIEFYRTIDKLTNLTDGGEGTLGFKKTIEMRNNSRLGMLGKKNMLGKKQTPETINKIKAKNIGKIRTSVFRERMREIAQKRTFSEETRKKISLAVSGQNASWYGKFGAEHNSSKKVQQFNLSGEFIREYGSTREAERETHTYHISCCCNGERKTAGGFIWKYK